MIEHREVRYATPSLTFVGGNIWAVAAHPWGQDVGYVGERRAGWTAITLSHFHVGLWPTKQAAAEVLVKQAGYELGEVGQ